ncbi:MAG: CsgG/HfaB family protein [Chitinispirillales bacterium]|nr:CsgG/HfaB family protein [Chitinispirillales bacterium]
MSNLFPAAKSLLLPIAIALAAHAVCAPSAKSAPGLVSLDAALTAAVSDIASKAQGAGKLEIAVSQIDAPAPAVSEFLTGELSARLFASGKFVVLERRAGAAQDAVSAEHSFQMSGSVSDSSIAGLGGYLGAKMVVGGALVRFAGFCQLRLQAYDVSTAQVLTQYTARIPLRDVGLR